MEEKKFIMAFDPVCTEEQGKDIYEIIPENATYEEYMSSLYESYDWIADIVKGIAKSAEEYHEPYWHLSKEDARQLEFKASKYFRNTNEIKKLLAERWADKNQFCVIKAKLPNSTLIDLVRNGEQGNLYYISDSWRWDDSEGRVVCINDEIPDELVELVEQICPTCEQEDEITFWISHKEIESLKYRTRAYYEERVVSVAEEKPPHVSVKEVLTLGNKLSEENGGENFKIDTVIEKEIRILNELPNAIKILEDKLNFKALCCKITENSSGYTVVDLGACYITCNEFVLCPVNCRTALTVSSYYDRGDNSDRSPYSWVLEVANDIDNVVADLSKEEDA